MKVVSNQDISGLEVEPESINQEELDKKLQKAEEEVADTESLGYQALTAGVYNLEKGSNIRNIQYLVAPGNYPEEPNSEPFIMDFEFSKKDGVEEKLDQIDRVLGEEYDVNEWTFNGLTDSYSLEKPNRDQDREDFIEESSRMPLTLTSTVDIGLDEKLRLGWFADSQDSEFGYRIKTGNPDKEFDSDIQEMEIESYLETQEFLRDNGERGYSNQEIQKIMEFDRYLMEKDIL